MAPVNNRGNDIKVQMVGEDPDLPKEASVLNRNIIWGAEGLWIEADPRAWGEIRAQARKYGHDVHMGYRVGMCVQTNSAP